MRVLAIGMLMINLCNQSVAQVNLVPNGSFEHLINCPDYYGNLVEGYVAEWSSPNDGSPDCYHVCGSEDWQVPPQIVYGKEHPLHGEGFVAMYFFSFNQPEGREYIQTRLSEPLHAGVRYKVSFYVSLAELSRYALSSIGAYLSVDQIQGNEFDVLEVEPQIQNPAGNIIADTSGWVLITDTFRTRAVGGEEWLTIGNFNYSAESDTFAFQPPNLDMGNFFHSYYYIDDVSVIALDSVPSSVAEIEELVFEVWPNPVKDALRFRVADVSEPQADAMTVRALDAMGRVVRNETLRTAQGNNTIDVSGLPRGIYILELTTDNGTRAVRKFVKE